MIEIKDIAGLRKPLTRLIEVISEGVGAVSRPYLVKKNAEAKAHEIRVISDALKDVAVQHQLPVIYKEGVVEVWQKPEDRSLILEAQSPEERALIRADYQERNRQQHIENITSIAAAELAQQEDVPDEKPDEDWISKFFSSAQDISSEQMQNLWGRILAGEIKRPGTYSLRTLEFVKNISKLDAPLLELVGKLAMKYGGSTAFVAAHDKKWLQENFGIFPGHQFAASEIGAMYPTDLSLRVFREDSIQEEYFVCGDLMLIVKKGDSTGEIVLPIWKFTAVGRELLELIANDQNEAYLESLGQFFLNRKCTAVLVKITEKLANGQLGYSPIRDICMPAKSD